ncbi:hypothetical protein J3458_001244 [Metarhizium acridum]|uniref:uncharacterized protein n=1 Tax=Metarhizium acridum TaxID=92637 RepID=UPI001C6BF168|nr:hypothetical protein J3458_001244 [Metarhizium acridum]
MRAASYRRNCLFEVPRRGSFPVRIDKEAWAEKKLQGKDAVQRSESLTLHQFAAFFLKLLNSAWMKALTLSKQPELVLGMLSRDYPRDNSGQSRVVLAIPQRVSHFCPFCFFLAHSMHSRIQNKMQRPVGRGGVDRPEHGRSWLSSGFVVVSGCLCNTICGFVKSGGWPS